jgi:glycosyltransferase involved in cell wall biosynthesis
MSPLKLFEYMASKRVIIAKYLPIYKHILNKKNSILIKSNLPKLWAREINYVFKNFKITKNLGFEAFRDVKNYTWNLRAEKIVKFLNV